MGLFGSTKIYVSSTVYNMAGDVNERPNYLKTLVANNIIAGTGGRSFTSSITDGYLKGPGIRIRNFGLWAHNGGLPAVGTVEGRLFSQLRIPPDAVATAIPGAGPGAVPSFQRIEVGAADSAYWAEQWMLANYPDLVNTDWKSDYDDTTNEVVVMFADLTEARFVPTDFDRNADYVYALYTLVGTREEDDVVEGSLVTLADGEEFPSVTGWDEISSEIHVESFTLTRTTTVTITYSDGRPTETSSSTTSASDSYNYYRAVYTKNEKLESLEANPDELRSIDYILNFFTDGVVTTEYSSNSTSEMIDDGTVTKTTTTDVAQQVLNVTRTYREDTREVVEKSWSRAALLIYKLGSGNAAIDAFVGEKNQQGFYMPFIPVRLDNKAVDETHFPLLVPQARKAYKKLTTGKFDKDVVQPLEENEHIDDIDYAYVMLGVALNTKENASRKYLFDFFKRLLDTQEIDPSDYDGWGSDQQEYVNYMERWVAWREAQFDETNPLFGTPEPVQVKTSAVATNEIRIRGNGDGSIQSNLDIRISWKAMSSETGTGLARPNAKIGDTWVEYGSTDRYANVGYNDGSAMTIDPQAIDKLNITRQVGVDSWEVIRITGLIHRNYIYKGKYVEIKAKDALADNEESGFLVPIHFETYSAMSIVDSTQMSMACCYMVINTYLVKKTGFFGSIFFKILLVVAVVAITVATGGSGAFSSGILGSSAAVGTALGLSGLAGLIVGAVANAIAAMLLTKLIGIGAVAIFGEKLGAIIATVASVTALAVGSGIMNGQSLSTIFANMGSAINILSMTSAVGDGVAGYVRASANETLAKTQKLQDEYSKRSAELSDLYAKTIGTDRAALDPLAIIGDEDWATIEKVESFLGRTLLTGSDIATFTMSMIDNFAAVTTSTELA